MNFTLIHALALLGLFFPVVLAFWLWDRKKTNARVALLEERISNVVPYWQAMQAKLIVDLTHPHPAAERVDELLQMLKADPLYKMSDEDRQELLEGLKRRAAGDDPQIGDAERRKCDIFPLVMEEVQKEAANENPMTMVQLIGIKKETNES